MPTYNIPKLARNKYNVVKDNVSNNVVTQTQLMNSFGSGNSSGGGIGITHNTFQQQSQVSSAIEKASYDIGLSTYSYIQSYYVAKDELAQASYVTTTSLQSTLESYVTQSQLSTNSYVTTTSLQSTLASYVTQQGLSAMSYTTTTMVDEKLQDYSKTSVDKEEDVTRTVTQNDGIIVLAANDSRATTVTLPTTGIEDGKVIYIINKTGHAFTITTSGSIVDKDSSSTSRATQTISDNVIQVIYYDGEWFVI